MEHEEEVIQVMVKCRRDVSLDDPMKSLSKEVENVWCRLKSKHQHEQVIKPGAPVNTKEMPISSPNGNVAKSFLQIELCHQSTTAKTS
jgi:hypothetical protein